MSHPQPQDPVRISSITLSVSQESRKKIDRLTFKSNSETFEEVIPVQIHPGHEHTKVFEPACELSAHSKLFIIVEYLSLLWRKSLTIDMELNEVRTKAMPHKDGKRVYSKSERNVTVAINISPMGSDTSRMPDYSTDNIISSPTRANEILPNPTVPNPPLTSFTDEILRICPRFRLLIIGDTGVGKSTLVQKVFGVENVHVSESSRGRADIDKEFMATQNELFVVHDSLGFEAGDRRNMDIVMRFIEERRRMPHLKDRLHAVWVCISVPYAGGRLLEAGIEEFLKNRKSVLGNVPVVVVITKLDLLDTELLQQERKQFKDPEEMQNFLNKRRSDFLEKHIAVPLRRAMGGDLPYVAVSTRGMFRLEPTIPKLVTTTTSQIEHYIRADSSSADRSERPSIERRAPLYIAGMAQRTSVESKVGLIINIARKGYWRNIGASVFFSGYKMSNCVPVIHEDIVRVWNFDCTEDALKLENFPKELWDTSHLKMLEVPNDIVENFKLLCSEAPLKPYVLPFAAVHTIKKLIDGVCNSTQNSIKCFMAYIVDLAYVMQFLFILARVTPENIARALDIYEKKYRRRIHDEIARFDTNLVMTVPGLGGCDVVMDEVERLIRLYPITDADALEMRAQIWTGTTS